MNSRGKRMNTRITYAKQYKQRQIESRATNKQTRNFEGVIWSTDETYNAFLKTLFLKYKGIIRNTQSHF